MRRSRVVARDAVLSAPTFFFPGSLWPYHIKSASPFLSPLKVYSSSSSSSSSVPFYYFFSTVVYLIPTETRSAFLHRRLRVRAFFIYLDESEILGIDGEFGDPSPDSHPRACAKTWFIKRCRACPSEHAFACAVDVSLERTLYRRLLEFMSAICYGRYITFPKLLSCYTGGQSAVSSHLYQKLKESKKKYNSGNRCGAY